MKLSRYIPRNAQFGGGLVVGAYWLLVGRLLATDTLARVTAR
ncbi:hypothetical protein [Acrocarpospora catenulata]|nr:hypothetical protein [Acrocarpospora catenulata]